MKQPIHKQQQLTKSSCVPACIAMITGVDQQLIIDEMAKHNDSCAGMHAECRQWVRMGYLPHAVPMNDLVYGRGKVMLATVPSLNIPGGNHRVIFDWQDESGIVVYDPNDGYPGREVYTWQRVRTWSELMTVECCR